MPAAPEMQFRPLGKTGVDVSLVSLGTGGPSQFGQRTGLSQADSERVLRRALDCGVNFIDTAESYGDSEVRLGQALRGVPRESYLLGTKWHPARTGGRATFFGKRQVVGDAPALRDAVDKSLRRLQLDTIDLMQLHGVELDYYAEVRDRFVPVLHALRDEGKIRFLGITERFMVDEKHEMLPAALADGAWDTVMVKYGILNQGASREILPRCERLGVGVLNMAAVRVNLTRPERLRAKLAELKAAGLLARDAVDDDDPLGWLVRGDVESVVAAGYKFGTHAPGISTVITGTSCVEHLDANVRAILGPPLAPDDHARLVELFGHLALAD